MYHAIPSLAPSPTVQPTDQTAVAVGDELLTVNDTARFLRVTVSWVYEHTRDDAERDAVAVTHRFKIRQFRSRRAYPPKRRRREGWAQWAQ